jgi:hypothetical protein
VCGRDAAHEVVGLSICNYHYEAIVKYLGDLAEDRRVEALRLQYEAERQSQCVYYAQRRDGYIKIGVTHNLKTRLLALKADHGELTLLCSHVGDRRDEGMAHDIFRDHNACGEWFVPSQELLEHIEEVKRGLMIAFNLSAKHDRWLDSLPDDYDGRGRHDDTTIPGGSREV